MEDLDQEASTSSGRQRKQEEASPGRNRDQLEDMRAWHLRGALRSSTENRWDGAAGQWYIPPKAGTGG
jgi:hypothetical protein